MATKGAWQRAGPDLVAVDGAELGASKGAMQFEQKVVAAEGKIVGGNVFGLGFESRSDQDGLCGGVIAALNEEIEIERAAGGYVAKESLGEDRSLERQGLDAGLGEDGENGFQLSGESLRVGPTGLECGCEGLDGMRGSVRREVWKDRRDHNMLSG